jgi:hypothetical protein
MRVAAALAALVLGASPAAVADCGPDKLGASRLIEVGTQGGLEVGLKTYPQTILLAAVLPPHRHESALARFMGPLRPEATFPLERLCGRAHVLGTMLRNGDPFMRNRLGSGLDPYDPCEIDPPTAAQIFTRLGLLLIVALGFALVAELLLRVPPH